MRLRALAPTALSALRADALFLPLAKGARPPAPLWKALERATRGGLGLIYQQRDFTGAADQARVAWAPGGGAPPRVVLVGLGDAASIDAEALRKLGARIVKLAREYRLERAAVLLPPEVRGAPLGGALGEGLLLGDYRFESCKSPDPEAAPTLREVAIMASAAGRTGLRAALARATVLAEATNYARELSNGPGNLVTPRYLAAQARALARRYRLRCTVYDESAMKRLGLGCILGVAQGSDEPARLMCLEYRGRTKKKPLVLVGKGLTFDAGGISIKPADKMEEMKHDMSGGAAVLGAMRVVGQWRPARGVVGVIPSTENLLDGRAYKPGDVLRAYNGTTIEVQNTDAEGRLILADALAYASKKYRPEAIIDLATLTGAVIIALGHHTTAVLSNDDALCERLQAASERSGEKLWRLPLFEDYREQLKSKVADLKNTGGRPAGTITAAQFLQRFVGPGIPWAHLDIAGTAWNSTPTASYHQSGATGAGVRLLAELIDGWR